MYACYIDESGHCGFRFNENQPVEVVCGIITDISKLFRTQRQLTEILRILEENKIFVKELKGSDIYRGRRTWHGKPPELRFKIIDLLLDWATERKCKFIVSPIDSITFFEKKRNDCTLSTLLESPYTAGVLNILLAIERYKSGTKKNKGKTLVVLDEQNVLDSTIISLIDSDLSFTDGYTGYYSSGRDQIPRLNEIIDIPFFSKSHLSPMIQIADIGAFIVNRYLQLCVYDKPASYNGEINQIFKWYSIIGKNIIPHLNINPPANDELCSFYRDIRPIGWSAKQWHVKKARPIKLLSIKNIKKKQLELFIQKSEAVNLNGYTKL